MDRVLSAAAAAALCLPLLGDAGDTSGEAAALLARHQTYVGWHAGDGAMKTLRAVGAATRDGKVIQHFELLRFGPAYRNTTVSEHGTQRAEGFTGTVAWTTSENGFTVRAVGEVVRYMYDEDALFGEQTAAGAFAPKLRKRETIGGTDTVVLRLTSQIGLPIDVSVDPATGAYKRVVIDPDGKYESRLEDVGYSEVDGKRFLSTWRSSRGKNTTFAYAKFEPNAPIEPDALHPPAQTATWTFGEGTVPIALVDYPVPRVFVDAIVNGRKGRFIVDTGADGTYIRDSFLRSAGAKKFGSTAFWNLSGGGSANLFRVETIAIGPSALHNIIVSSGFEEGNHDWEGADGLIGFDMLAASIVELNLDAKTLRIMDPALVAPDASKGYVVHVDVSDGHIRVPMKIDDTQDALAILDTGAFDSILFARDLITRQHVRFGGDCSTFGSLTLGPVRYERPSACVNDAFLGDEMLVGLDFLKHFNFVFDYPDGLIVMMPRKMP